MPGHIRSGAASEGTRHKKEQFEAAVKRIDEQLAHARANEAALGERGREYEELDALLEELPGRLDHPVMVPFGPLAFFPGVVQHTSEVLTQLSSEWFVLRPAKHARGLVARRQGRLRSDQADVARELEELRAQRRVAASVAGLPAEAEAQAAAQEREGGASVRVDDDGYFDIREPVGDEAEAGERPEGATVRIDDDGYFDIQEPIGEADREEAGPKSPAAAAPAAPQPTGQTLAPEGLADYARLRELERLDEEGAEEAPAFAPAPRPAAAATQRGRPDAMEELRRLEEMEALDALDELLECSEQNAGGACHPQDLEEAAEQPARAPAATSPADIFEAMRRAEEAVGPARGPAATPLPARVVEARPSLPAASEAAPDSAALTARVVEARPSLPAADEADGAGGLGSPFLPGAAAGSAAVPPPRVSKFKADRQRARD